MEILEALQAYAEKIDERFNDLESRMNERFDKIDQRLDYHESWLKQIDAHLETVATKKQLGSLLVFLENKEVISTYQAEYVNKT